ncbi:hypothetical protein [Umezawaea sp. Da 62-37]|uniref:hypothetical protein n=1 Tax=Umezawaea sp. Da 62-37 TaxID=3075927 RepID=UPI0028F6DF8F|nr:hypothetical protein [Umezawaea sp. Da 62-37]WNV87484.1 hypothetical protein RM788_04045 [Umezawaea sp. Da 62-37]
MQQRTAEGTGFLGVDPQPNVAAHSDADLTGGGAAVRTVEDIARENLRIAYAVRTLLGG